MVNPAGVLLLVLQVILAQMEVYEKSLKNAQRGLLRKAEWGAGITPTPEVTHWLPEVGHLATTSNN